MIFLIIGLLVVSALGVLCMWGGIVMFSLSLAMGTVRDRLICTILVLFGAACLWFVFFYSPLEIGISIRG